MTGTASYVHKLNIVRFECLLAKETDPVARQTLLDLLTREHALLEQSEAQLFEAFAGNQ